MTIIAYDGKINKKDIKWRVEPVPTGDRFGIVKRRFPTAEHRDTGRMLFRVECKKTYINAKCNSHNHPPIYLNIAKSTGDGRWTWVEIEKPLKNMAEAKDLARSIYMGEPELFI